VESSRRTDGGQLEPKNFSQLEVEELLAQGIFVLLFGSFCLFAGFFFGKAGGFPFVEVGYGVFGGGKGLFFADGGDPFLDCGSVGDLELIELCGCGVH
jgi:hypothetical protein